ncbi:MAG TPA: hypothetical protein VF950_10875 [Planctomycetota bacterium]
MVATGLLGCFTLPIAIAGAAIAVAVVAGNLPPVSLLVSLHAAVLGLSLWGLWRGALWGWFLAAILLGMFSLAAFLGAVRSVLAGADGLVGATLLGTLAFLGAAPLVLLVKARARYQAWANSKNSGSG